MRISDLSSDVCSSDLMRSNNRHAPVVQPLSIDEAFLELTPESDGTEIAKAIRQEIFEATQCPASAGVSRSEERRVGKSVSVRVERGGRRIIKKKRTTKKI